MTSGDGRGASGPPLIALALTTVGLTIAAAVNVWTRIHDQPALSRADRLWEPVVWEASSALIAVALIPLVWRSVVDVERTGAGRPASVIRALGYAAAFVVLHVAGFVLLRWAAYAITGHTYVFGGIHAWLYELPKELLTFVIIAAILLAGRRLTRPPEVVFASSPPVEPLRIKDGNRTLLVKPDEIFAANASGNYVEYHLADGRRPLARTRLGEAEAALAPHGFIRTHRSWLANRQHIREVRPSGNGDYELVIAPNLLVPVSRRFAEQVLLAVR